MKCLKCGNELKDNEIMCSNCGYNRNTVADVDNQFATRNIGVYNQNPVDKEEVAQRLENQKQFSELIEIYIGSKHANFRRGGFSWCAFFLGPIYFVYRKLYAVAGIIYVLNLIISNFFTSILNKNIMVMQNFIIFSIVTFIFQLFQGIVFKKFYFNEVVERVGKIKQQNPDLGFNQLAELVKKKGGTNIIATIIIAVTIIAVLLVAIIGLVLVPLSLGLL